MTSRPSLLHLPRHEDVVAAKQTELLLAQLRFLSKFYITVIETRQDQMNAAHRRFLADRDDMVAYFEWTSAKKKIENLYECWLRELNDVTCPPDPPAQILAMSQMMQADCYWFLAKMDRPAFDVSRSNYNAACQCLERILGLMTSFPADNPFLVHIVHKYAALVEEYVRTVFRCESRLPSNMFLEDRRKSKESMMLLRRQMQRLYGNGTQSPSRTHDEFPRREKPSGTLSSIAATFKEFTI